MARTALVRVRRTYSRLPPGQASPAPLRAVGGPGWYVSAQHTAAAQLEVHACDERRPAIHARRPHCLLHRSRAAAPGGCPHGRQRRGANRPWENRGRPIQTEKRTALAEDDQSGRPRRKNSPSGDEARARARTLSPGAKDPVRWLLGARSVGSSVGSGFRPAPPPRAQNGNADIHLSLWPLRYTHVISNAKRLDHSAAHTFFRATGHGGVNSCEPRR